MINLDPSRVSTDKADRLNLVQVHGLFGVFDHTIPLSNRTNITVIHGPNGVGKTILLRMIREIFSGKSDVLSRVPFDRLELKFESNDFLVLYQLEDKERNGSKRIRYEVNLGGILHRGTFVPAYNPEAVDIITNALGSTWEFIEDGFWRDVRDGETLNFSEVRRRTGVSKKVFESLKAQDPVILQIREKCNVRFIGTDRLISDRPSERSPQMYIREPTPYYWPQPPEKNTEEKSIAVYSANLKERIGEVISNYGKLTERLDRSLVKRLLQGQFDKQTSVEVLARFSKLDSKRQQLIDLGLLTETDDVIGSSDDAAVLDLVSKSEDVFSLYVLDMEQKLALFDDLREKVQILVDRTNQRFQFKKFEIDPSEGFVFESDTGSKLLASDLSSGEQHEMILFYEMLFSTNEGDLVLIDEPEISLHVEWQLEFLNDLRAALRSSNTYVLLATHAPALAQGAGEYVVPLGPFNDT